MSTSEGSRKFHFIREIASGGFGSVYLAKVIHADGFSRLAAVKLLHAKWSENEEIASRMRDEARLLGWLRHKNIVDVMDLTKIDGRWAVIMEYLEGIDLKVIINYCKREGALFPIQAAIEVTAAAASALDAAYNRPPYAGEKPLRVIHRDIKPSNIMIDHAGMVKVLDFGVARAEFDQREAHTQELAFGSLEYMPPERLFFEPETPASDMYSLGATLYELLSLEKLGKARLRPKDHEAFLSERFDFMFERLNIQNDQLEDEVYDTLSEMLAFEESNRLSAANCVTRLRALSRRLNLVGVEEWSERTIPRILQEARGEPDKVSQLLGRVISEDVRAFPGVTGEQDLPPGSPGHADTYSLPTDVDEQELDHTGRQDDARWSALKQATINELVKNANYTPAPVANQRQAPSAPRNAKTEPPHTDMDLEAEQTEEVVPPPDLVLLAETNGIPPGTKQDSVAVAAESPLSELPQPSASQRPPNKPAKPSPSPSARPKPRGLLVRLFLYAAFSVVSLTAIVLTTATGIATGYKAMGGGATPWTAQASPAPPEKAASPSEERAEEIVRAFEDSPSPQPEVASDEGAPVDQPEALKEGRPDDEAPEPEEASVNIDDEVPPSEPASAAEAPVPLSPTTTFRSGLALAKKISVQCDAGQASGVDEAIVQAPDPGSCRVTAISSDRKRRSTTVKDTTPAGFTCFEGSSEECLPSTP